MILDFCEASVNEIGDIGEKREEGKRKNPCRARVFR
jgi:hypothetical protein